MILVGHYLRYEGAAFDERGCLLHGQVRRSGQGRAKCSCGELSDVLDSGAKRRQWHRDHKEEVAQNSRQVQA